MTNLFDDNYNKPDTGESNVPRSNVPEFSVSEIAFSLKRTLEDTYARVRVRGELSRVSIPRSGHMYTTLKDDQSNLDAVCWKGVLSRLPIKPEEGMEVICTGKITTYHASSKYQLVIENMELAGEGALLKLLEERKKKLGAEGLFSADRKQPIPFLPRKIGVVTSPTGAVIRDILHRLNDRFPRHVLVWPVLVQGTGAAQQVAAAIRGFDALPKDQKPDTLIIARGGGSLEDLMPFNEEIVVRAIADCTIPTISAIGHETDTTLADYAADLRAPTPTGAAEMAVPVRENLITQVMDNQKRLFHAWVRFGSECKHRLDAAAAKLGDPSRLLETQIQRLDLAESRLSSAYNAYIHTKHNTLIERAGRLTHPRHIIEQSAQRLENHAHRLAQSGSALIDKKRTALNERTARLLTPAHIIKQSEQALSNQLGQLARIERTLFEKPQDKLENVARMLETLSYTRTLERGYVVVRDDKGKPVSKPDQIKKGQMLDLEFGDSRHVSVRAENTATGMAANKAPNTAKESQGSSNTPDIKKQESLF